MAVEDTRIAIKVWIEKNPKGWETKTADNIAEALGISTDTLKNNFPIVMAELEKGKPDDFSSLLRTEKEITNEANFQVTKELYSQGESVLNIVWACEQRNHKAVSAEVVRRWIRQIRRGATKPE